MNNYFAEGENRVLVPPATALVIFGATGDLSHRKLIPALYNLAHDGFLPDSFIMLGVSRSKHSDEEFRAEMYEAIKSHSRRTISEDVWREFSQKLFYSPIDVSSQEDFARLKSRLEVLCSERGGAYNYLYYLSVAPKLFGTIGANLRAVGLVEEPKPDRRRTALIVEKPFGHDLVSARELNEVLRANFAEEQIFRIDHYLGKETVQNILVFRFANGIFEPLWNRNYIDHIQISMAEEIGVGSRASYFDNAGIIRDIIQNHLLQVLSLLCIEPPLSLSDPESIRDEKVKVLKCIRRMSEADVPELTVRARYEAGFINGKEVPAYLNEQGVAATSTTDTFAAMKLFIDNWRWAGVPIYLRAGKRMPKRITEITVFFKKAPESMFRGRLVQELEQNVLAIQVQPNEGISLKVCSKPPGPRLRVKPVVMDFNYGDSFGVPSADAYERLLLDAMKGEQTLFTRDDEIEQAWELLAPVLSVWQSNDQKAPPVFSYPAGSWGPEESDLLLAKEKHSWRQL